MLWPMLVRFFRLHLSFCDNFLTERSARILPVTACIAKAIELNPKYVKAYYRCATVPSFEDISLCFVDNWWMNRRAMAHLQVLKPHQAVSDLKKVMALEPNNAEVKKQLESTQKMVRKIEFEKVCARFMDKWCGC